MGKTGTSLTFPLSLVDFRLAVNLVAFQKPSQSRPWISLATISAVLKLENRRNSPGTRIKFSWRYFKHSSGMQKALWRYSLINWIYDYQYWLFTEVHDLTVNRYFIRNQLKNCHIQSNCRTKISYSKILWKKKSNVHILIYSGLL